MNREILKLALAELNQERKRRSAMGSIYLYPVALALKHLLEDSDEQ